MRVSMCGFADKLAAVQSPGKVILPDSTAPSQQPLEQPFILQKKRRKRISHCTTLRSTPPRSEPGLPTATGC